MRDPSRRRWPWRDDSEPVSTSTFARAVAGAAWLACLVAAADGCSAQEAAAPCERLRRLSCGCFPTCAGESAAVIDSQDPTQCGDWMRTAYTEWQDRCAGGDSGAGRCGAGCAWGWGECAFVVYRELGFSPTAPCPSDADGGVDAD